MEYNGKHVYTVDDFSFEVVKVGDYITEEKVMELMDMLPPVNFSTRCSQIGEPKTSRYDEHRGTWRNSYETFKKVSSENGGIWEFCGDCFAGETVMRGKPMQEVSICGTSTP